MMRRQCKFCELPDGAMFKFGHSPIPEDTVWMKRGLRAYRVDGSVEEMVARFQQVTWLDAPDAGPAERVEKEKETT